jgi:hypothetical protein
LSRYNTARKVLADVPMAVSDQARMPVMRVVKPMNTHLARPITRDALNDSGRFPPMVQVRPSRCAWSDVTQTQWALRDSNPRPAGCKDLQGRSSVTQFVAARRIIPGHSGCQAGVTDASATYGDVLTPNCWDASWDENASTSPPGRLASKTVSFRLMGPESMSIERCPPVVPCRVVSAIPTSARCL